MSIPTHIHIKNDVLPDEPGVYLYYGAKRKLLYVGKATSLKKRVNSYFSKKYKDVEDAYGARIGKMVSEITTIDYMVTPTVIEALVLEANLVRTRKPYYNVRLQDDKTFLFLAITDEEYPKPLLVRGLELSRKGLDPFAVDRKEAKQHGYLAVYGPFTSPRALRNALDLLRKIFPWSVCDPPEVTGKRRPCFYAHIKRCPGVCTGRISSGDYKKHIRGLMQFFDGKKMSLITRLEREMKKASDQLAFERANMLKRQIASLQHIRDISVITNDFSPLPYENPDKDFVDGLGRVEAYDISNISGTNATGSMVVFEHGVPNKSAYRKFKIKTVEGPNDVAAMQEVMRRRLLRAQRYPKAWVLPDVMVIDGGRPQVNAVMRVLREFELAIPVVGLAKGPDRKKDELIYDRDNKALAAIVHGQKVVFQRARDEAHRFAGAYHRHLRRKQTRKKTKRA